MARILTPQGFEVPHTLQIFFIITGLWNYQYFPYGLSIFTYTCINSLNSQQFPKILNYFP
jgi:hypothetical protein